MEFSMGVKLFTQSSYNSEGSTIVTGSSRRVEWRRSELPSSKIEGVEKSRYGAPIRWPYAVGTGTLMGARNFGGHKTQQPIDLQQQDYHQRVALIQTHRLPPLPAS